MEQQQQTTDLRNYAQTKQLVLDNKMESETVKFLLDVKESVFEKLQHYRGYFFNRDAGKWIQLYKEEERTINDHGVDYVQRAMLHMTNKVAALGNLDKQQVSILILNFSNRVRRTLIAKRKTFDIKDVNVINEVKNDIVDMGFMVLSRSVDDKERKYIWKGQTKTEHSVFNEQPSSAKSKLGW